jgi:hypothetical protein
MNRKIENDKSLIPQFRFFDLTSFLYSFRRYWSVYLAFIVVLAGVAGCNYTIESIVVEKSYHPSFSIPLLEVNVTGDDLIDDLQLKPVLPDTLTSPAGLFELYGLSYKTPANYNTVIVRDFSLSDFEEYMDDVTRLMFRVNVTNYTHGRVKMQVYFHEDNGSLPIDSLFAAGPLQVSGGTIKDKSIVHFESLRNDEEFSHSRIMALSNCTSIKITLFVYFPQDAVAVQLNEASAVNVQVALRTGIDIDPNEIDE